VDRGGDTGLALGPYIFGQTIDLFGYVPSRSGDAAPQSANAELGVLLGFTVVPTIVVGLALLFLRAYDLTADNLAAVEVSRPSATANPSTP
jgi:GPH family glycoside/pentoside/hexuronide:cation symporter